MKYISQYIRKLIKKSLRLIIPILSKELELYQHKQQIHKNLKLMHELQSCGEGVVLNGKINISRPKFVCIGSNVHIGDDAEFSTRGGLTIGNNTHISRRVTINTTNHLYEGTALPYDDRIEYKPVFIGKNVWIGRNVTIIPGVSISDGAIIGMGAVVNRDVAPMEVVGNNPLRTLKYRDYKRYNQLEQDKKYGGRNGEVLSVDETINLELDRSIDDENIFFVATTGRSGSTTFAKFTTQHSSITCLHQPRPQLVRLSTEYAHDLKDTDSVMRELHAIYRNSSVFPKSVYGECDQKFWNLITPLGNLLPNSQFIWLIRDGRDVVASTFGRGWYSNIGSSENSSKDKNTISRYWKNFRLNGVKCGSISMDVWEKMSVFERNCWYWSYVNSQIENQFLSLPEKRKLFIRLEDLNKQTRNLLNFLRVNYEHLIIDHHNIAHYKVRRYFQWTDIEKKAFEKWCGHCMDKWYPNWRADY